MKIWAVMTQKGGSGKTTIAIHLALAATKVGIKAAIVDVDPQKSAVKWSMIRGKPHPEVVPAIVPELPKTLQALRADLAIIDTSPRADRDAIAIARMTDLVIVPVQPSILDLSAAADTLRLLKDAGCMDRVAIVMNSVPPSTTEGKHASQVLEKYGRILPGLSDRADFRRALTFGKGVTEFAPMSKGAQEVGALFVALANLSPV